MTNLLPLIHLQTGSVFARFREPRKCGILSVLGNPGGEPRPGSSDPDEEHRASARIRRRRRKRVVNAKIAIHFKRDACKICAVWDIPVICAEQRLHQVSITFCQCRRSSPNSVTITVRLTALPDRKTEHAIRWLQSEEACDGLIGRRG